MVLFLDVSDDESSDEESCVMKDEGVFSMDRTRVRSRFRHHKQRSNLNIPLGIFWDIENCQVTMIYSGYFIKCNTFSLIIRNKLLNICTMLKSCHFIDCIISCKVIAIMNLLVQCPIFCYKSPLHGNKLSKVISIDLLCIFIS